MSSVLLALTVITSAIGGLLFGLDIGLVNGVLVMPFFKDTFRWANTLEEGFIVSSLQIGCFIGSLMSSWMCDTWGRRFSILIGAIIFCAGGTIQTFVSSLVPLYIGRFVAGLAIGVLSMAVPLFLAEIAPKHLRGRLIGMQQLAITVGILLSFLITLACAGIESNASWRIPFSSQIVISVLMAVGMLFLPASPRWLASKGRDGEAAAALVRIRGGQRTAAVDEELEEIRSSIRLQQEIGDGSWGELIANGMWRRLGIGVMLQIFQQLTGINALMYYATQILGKAGFVGLQAQLIANAGTGVVNVAMTLPGMFLVDKAGRKPLLIAGSASIAVTMGVLGAMIGIYGPAFENKAVPYVCLAAIYLFIAGFAATWGPIGWIIPAEIYPLRIRAKALSITTAANWVSNALIAQVVPPAMEHIGYGVYLFFAACGVVMGLWVLLFVPETKGKSFEEIDRMFGQEGVSDAREAELKAQLAVGGH